MSFKTLKITCPCGSGVNYRDCHGDPIPAATPDIARAAIRAFRVKAQQERAWHEQFGTIAPPMSAKMGQHTMVVVGDQMHAFRGGETFHEFLLAYLDERVGRDWVTRELKKPMRGRHPLVRWRTAVGLFLARNAKPEETITDAKGEGVVTHYFRLAYDLFTLQHTGLLEDRLVHRLKVREQFQGARYEIHVAAACRRAGFEVELEDEADVRRSHCEFSITHPPTGSRFSVEAKSRHRPGVLGYKGRLNRKSIPQADIAHLVIKALKKEADHTRVVFVDLNVPDEKLGSDPETAVEALKLTLDELKRREAKTSPWPPAILIITNRPNHYLRPLETDCRDILMIGALNMPDTEGSEEGVSKLLATWPAIGELGASMSSHTGIPGGFGYESAELP